MDARKCSALCIDGSLNTAQTHDKAGNSFIILN